MRKLLLGSLFCWLGVASAQNESDNNVFHHPFYIGGMGGYGSTTWQGLVPQQSNQNAALSLATPIEVREGGGVWGLALGYELTPYFALEANYMQFPDAELIFDEFSLFAFDHDGLTSLHTTTEMASLNAKIMLWLPRTKSFRIFSSTGIASVFRQDEINDLRRISPTFGFGFNFLITDRFLMEIGSNYTAGYGESEINPVLDFIPFLYSVYGKLALRFG